MKDSSEIWHLIRDAQDARGWTNQHLSEISGVPESSIQKFLSGKTAEPRFDNVMRLCAALGLSIDALCGISIDTGEAAEEIRNLRNSVAIAEERVKAAEANERAINAELKAKDYIIAEMEKSNTRLYKFVTAFAALFVALVIAVVGILVYDIVNLDRGWFQTMSDYYYTGINAITSYFV